MNKDNPDMNKDEEQEIDLIEIIQNLWLNRRLIIKTTLVFMALGLFIAVFSAKEYTTQCTMVPQSSDKSIGGNIGGLAALAGANLGATSGENSLSPQVYPIILKSIPFQKELIYTPFDFEQVDHPISLLEYYSHKEYQPFNLLAFIKSYTLGLPAVIITTIRGKQAPETGTSDQPILALTENEKSCIKILESKIGLNLNSKDGYITLTVNMPEPLLAAQVALKAQTLLQQYITEFKVEKVQFNLNFVQERFDEAQQDFERIQEERAIFRDANKNVISAKAQTESERLDARYNLSLGIYTELAKQLEQAKIQVKETIPILTIIDPVSVPSERSKPKRGLICILFTFLGICIGIGTVLLLPLAKKWKESRRQ